MATLSNNHISYVRVIPISPSSDFRLLSGLGVTHFDLYDVKEITSVLFGGQSEYKLP